jgi:serine/threonine protein phosphatase PrpC
MSVSSRLVLRATRGQARVALAGELWVVETFEEPASAGQDRIATVSCDDVLTLAIADGAGGTSHGAKAAERAVASAALADISPATLIRRVDLDLARGIGGQTTAVLVRLSADARVRGASVGDSQAWARCDGDWTELTEHQSRRPLVGSGGAEPTPFSCGPVDALLLATDGLVSYVAPQRLVALLRANEVDLPAQLADAARLPSGALQDDLALILVRKKPAAASGRGDGGDPTSSSSIVGRPK